MRTYAVRSILMVLFLSGKTGLYSQVKWVNADSGFLPLPAGVQVFKTTDPLEGKPFIACYVKARLKDASLDFTVDTTLGRRLTPLKFYEKNGQPLLVVNCTFFNFDRNQNLNTVIRNGKQVGYSIHSLPMRGKDTFQYRHPLASAFGIDKNRDADIAWLLTDSSKRFACASQSPIQKLAWDSVSNPSFRTLKSHMAYLKFKKWKMRTAVGGGPVIVQDGKVKISNNEEWKFAGNAIKDKHPRTCVGYTPDGYLIILVIQGRFPGIAEGATLEQEARILVELGCTEAMNLDGGGSSCMLVNGKETIKPSDKEGQRPVPAVFIIAKN